MTEQKYLSAILDATVVIVAPSGKCEVTTCTHPVTREVYGGTYGDGSDWWEKYLCGNCLRALEAQTKRDYDYYDALIPAEPDEEFPAQ